ncbi:MAG TPA: phosphoenolpyruvate synthase, partial [Syntrophales bacterium]|nr:phosphoenolpyruvate synthase [Syntrophales bacterium]
NIAVLGEIAYQEGSLIPDLSFGTHFFQDLVEAEIFYLAIYPERQAVRFNRSWWDDSPNLLGNLSPGDRNHEDTLKVFDVGDRNLRLISDVVSQKVVCLSLPKNRES